MAGVPRIGLLAETRKSVNRTEGSFVVHTYIHTYVDT